jgi:hypothetical protein
MDEQESVLRAFEDAGVLRALEWANRSSYGEVWRDFNPEGGHDQGWAGYTAHKYLVNRLDRVFSCGDFAVDLDLEDGDPNSVGRDLLALGISDRDFSTMPEIPAGTVTRADLNGSPGWMLDGWRWILASHSYGRIHKIRWPAKSYTKGKVAQQPYADVEDGLFGYDLLGMLPPIEELVDPERLLRQTLVLGHAMDLTTGDIELHLGRSRWNHDRGDAWDWVKSLLNNGSGEGSRGMAPRPAGPTGPQQVPDAPVRLRQEASGSSRQSRDGA